jgi:hypothetical protein
VPLLKYISFFFYANETVAINFWLTVDEIKCNTDRKLACFPNGTAVLESFGFAVTELDIYKDYAFQLILIIVLHVLAFFGIKRNVQKTGFY